MALGWLGDWFADFINRGNMIQSLHIMATSRTPVRIEIERTPIWFITHVALPPDGKVVLEKPVRIGSELRPGSFVRLRIPGDHKMDIRLEVSVPHHILVKGGLAFICMLPEEVRACRRRTERHPARHHKSLFLQIGGEKFELVDISAAGLKYRIASEQGPDIFPIGKDIAPARLVLSQAESVQLERIVPRSHQAGMAGCEIKVAEDPASQQHFEAILKGIQAAASEGVRA